MTCSRNTMNWNADRTEQNGPAGISRGLYTFLQIVWGLPQTLAGAVVFAVCALQKCSRERFYGAVVTRWPKKSSLSLGLFLFVTDDPLFHYGGRRTAEREAEMAAGLKVHEFGHSIQSLYWGPLYLLAVGLPSLVWAWAPPFVRKRKKEHISYFAVWPESRANELGERYTGLRSPGKA